MESSQAGSSKIVFVHLPKCGGTATTNALRRALKPRSEYFGHSISTFGHFEAFETCSDACLKTIVREASDLPPGADFVCGHLQYQFTRQAYPDHRFLLLMREPRSRLVSHWLYWRSNSDEVLAPWGEWGEWVKSARQDFAEFLSDPRGFSQTDNVAARMLLQPHPTIREGELIPRSGFADLESSIGEILDAIDSLGFTEDPELQQRLEQFIGQTLEYKRENVTFVRTDDLDLDVRKQVELVDPALIDRMTFLDGFVWRRTLERSGFTGNIGEFADQCFRQSLDGYTVALQT